MARTAFSYQGSAIHPCLIVRAVTSDGTTGTAMARMCADGSIIGTTKSFEETHPTRPGQRIVYAAPEGPEVALYARGSGTIGRGPVKIELPEHFSVLAAADTVTALVTPVGACPGGLYVLTATSAAWSSRAARRPLTRAASTT